jgi:acyl carrier protein
MGLELVELVIAVEHRFGIEIPDRVARTLTTPRKLIDHVWGRVASPEDICASQRRFHRVRGALVEAGADRRDVRPSARVDAILPDTAPRVVRKNILERLGMKTGLLRRRWLSRTTVADLARAAGPWSRAEVADEIRALVRELAAVEAVSDDADFVRDLGMG